MISVYFNDNGIFAAKGKSGNGKLKITERCCLPYSDNVTVKLIEFIKKISDKRDNLTFTVNTLDSSVIEKQVFCLAENKLNEIVKFKTGMENKTKNEKTKYLLTEFDEKSKKKYNSKAVITVLPKFIGAIISDVINACALAFTIDSSHNNRNRAVARFVRDNEINNGFVLLDFCDKRIIISAYTEDKLLSEEKYEIKAGTSVINALTDAVNTIIKRHDEADGIRFERIYYFGAADDDIIRSIYEKVCLPVSKVPRFHKSDADEEDFALYLPAFGAFI